ncbi:MAG TPA: helix-turn-helix domain-containing protein [Herpetosiphonaceae bacterium]|nr:helix-turn-helix domain-containing protein [Herpetosiphonaceae bacterium]
MATAAYHTQPARPTAAAILAYLAAGHTNADAAAHFGIHERSVRRIKQRATEQVAPTRVTVPPPISPAGEPSPGPTFPPTADDVAGDHTMWKCPATGELMPIVPGTRRHDWERERKEAHARHVAAVMSRQEVRTLDPAPSSAEPDRTGRQPFSAWESERTGPDSSVLGAYVAGPDRTAAPWSSDKFDPQSDDVPLVTEDQELPRAPMPPEPEPSIPTSPADSSTLPVKPLDPARDPRIYQPDVPRELNTKSLNKIETQRVIVRVPEQRQLGGLLGWLATWPMVGPFPVAALLLAVVVFLAAALGLLG